jgi:hypothetical protein
MDSGSPFLFGTDEAVLDSWSVVGFLPGVAIAAIGWLFLIFGLG